MMRLVSRSPAWMSSPALLVSAGDGGPRRLRFRRPEDGLTGERQRLVKRALIGGVDEALDHAAEEVGGLDALPPQCLDGLDDGAVVLRVAVVIDDELAPQAPAGVVLEDLGEHGLHRVGAHVSEPGNMEVVALTPK